MLKNLEGARLGIFIFLGSVLLILFIFFIGNKESLFENTIYIKAYFSAVEGLKPGAPVRLSGYDIGSVNGLVLSSDGSGKVEVTLRVQKSLQHFIRFDSEASIETEGLVGKKIVTITPGSGGSPIVKDGSVIKSKDPVNVSQIIEETQEIMAYVKDITKDFSGIVANINKGEGTIGKLVNDDELYKSTVSVTQSADRSMTAITSRLNQISDIIVEVGVGLQSVMIKIDTTIANFDGIVKDVRKGKGTIGGLLTDRTALDSIQAVINNLVQTTKAAQIGTEAFAENMEALKRNWLFKTYFEQRGYWDKGEYEQSLNTKLNEIENQQKKLDEKFLELKKLEDTINKLKNNSN
ncbi:MAG: MlaD family protein [bacterium]